MKKDEIISLFRAGKSRNIIARELGVDERWVRRVIKRDGIPAKRGKQLKEVVLPKVELTGADFHFPDHDEQAFRQWLEYGRMLQPDLVALLGDICENERFSRWPKDPQNPPAFMMFAEAKRQLTRIRNNFPHSRIIFLEGNHDGWFRRYLWGTELLKCRGSTLSEQLDLEELEIDYIDSAQYILEYGRPFRIGKLYHIHGDELRIGGGCINIARQLLVKTLSNVICGHWHRDQADTMRTVEGSLIGGWSTGCLRNLNPRFMPINQWTHGFAEIRYKPNGEFEVATTKIHKGRLLG